MKNARLHSLLGLALVVAGAGCGGGTRACKQGTLFVTIALDGTTSDADEVGVSVSIDGGAARTARHSRAAGGTTESIEIDFPNGYPIGRRVDVQVTAYKSGSPIGVKTGTVTSLADGCASLTVTVEPGGSPGTGGMGGTGGAGGGAAGRGGAGGSTSSAAGRGGSSAGTGGTGGGTAGRGGTGGGTAGRGGTGGGAGSPLCASLATFDTSGVQGFGLNTFMDTIPNASINLAVREAGARATISWDGTDGQPSAGSLKVEAPFDAYNQFVDIQRLFGTSAPQNWTGTKLHARVKVMGGNPSPLNPMGVQPYVLTGTSFKYCSAYVNLIAGNGWNDYVLDLSTCTSPVDPSMVVAYGVNLQTGNGSNGDGGTNSMPPTMATIHVDSFWLEGTCSPGTGGAGGAGGTGGSPMQCLASDPAPSALISDFSMMDAGAPSFPLGGTFVYPSPPAAMPSAVVQNGTWHVTLAATGTATPQYLGVGMYFNGTVNWMDCVDATIYTGISFKIAGAVTGTNCFVGFAINDSQHADSTVDMKGRGPAGSFSPSIMLTPAQITSAAQTINVPFTGTGSPTGGSPATAIDKMWLTGMAWQFTVPAGTANSCQIDLTLDDVKFY